MYGLEIARNILKCPEILNRAMQLRNKLLNNSEYIINPKKSRYNKHLYMDICTCCKTNANLQTHHILYQKDDPMFKNKKNNLVNLCEVCHQKIHKNELSIHCNDIGDNKYEYIFTTTTNNLL